MNLCFETVADAVGNGRRIVQRRFDENHVVLPDIWPVTLKVLFLFHRAGLDIQGIGVTGIQFVAS